MKGFLRTISALLVFSLGASASEKTTSLKVNGSPALRSIVDRQSGQNQTIRVLAIRVEFQPDTLAETTGEGRFDL